MKNIWMLFEKVMEDAYEDVGAIFYQSLRQQEERIMHVRF